MRALVRCLQPTGRLLLLRARAPDGTSIATGIFPALNGVAYFWGGASWRAHQVLRPNEAVFWYAMRNWKVPFVRTSRFRGPGTLRTAAQRPARVR